MSKKKPAYEELNKKIKELEKELEQSRQVEKTLREREKKRSSLVKKTQELQPASMEKLSKAVHHAPLMMTISAIEDGTYLDINEKFTEISGFSPEEVLGKTSTELGWISPEDRKRLVEELEAQGYVNKMDLTLLTKNKQRVQCLYSGELITIDGRQMLLSIAQDITESKQAEDSLKFERSQLLSIFENIEAMVYVLDPKTHKIIYANRFMREFLGKDPVGEFCFKEIKNLDRPCDSCKNKIILKNKSKPIKLETYNSVLDKYFSITQRIIKWPDSRDVRLQIAIDITERKQAEKALKESEEKYRSLFDTAPIGIGLTTSDGRILDFNENFSKITGYSPEELCNVHVNNMYKNPEERKKILELLQKNGLVRNYEVELRRKDNSTYYSNLNITPITMGNNNVLVTVCEDITERKRAEEALHDSRHMLQTVLDSIPAAVFWKDLDSIYLGGNQNFLEAAGLNSSEEVVGKSDYELPWDKEQADSFLEDDRGVMESGIPKYNIIEDFHIADGTHEWVKTNKVPLLNMEGITVGVLGTYEIITERKQAEEALKESEKKYRFLFDNMLSAFSYHKILFDQENNPVSSVILEVNDAWGKITGLKREEVLGKSVTDLFSEIFDRDYDWYGIVRKVVLKGEKIKFDHYMKSRDQWFSYSYYSPKKGYLAVVFEDITERKKVQRELERSQEQLRNLTAYLREVREEERTRISREIHDELGQLLTALSIDVSLLGAKFNKDQDSLKEDVKLILNSIVTAVETVQRIARDLRPGLLDELGLVAAIEWETEKFGERIGIECKVHLDIEDDDLDRNLSTNVFRIFQEALTNVARHAGASELKIGLQEVKNELILRVVDNGRGIPEEKISDPHSFGLMGVQERARFLGGRVDISGIRNKGTSVILSIPIMRLESA
jgi:PAS domain S-box-containing protein